MPNTTESADCDWIECLNNLSGLSGSLCFSVSVFFIECSPNKPGNGSTSAMETIKLRLGLLTAAWQAMDAAITSLDEIGFDAQRCA